MTSPFFYLTCAWVLASGIQYTIAQSTSPDFDPQYAQHLQTKLNQLGVSGNFAGGLTAAVLVPGQGIWTGTWGRSALNTPVTPQMRFGMASNSKAIVAGLILKLRDEGLLDLNDPISDYLPPHPHIAPQITIRQLLEHTSGLFDYINQWSSATQAAYSANPNRIWTYEDLLATVGPPVAPPNTGYSYSNTNYLLLGRIAEVAAQQPIHQLLHSRIFMPLGLQMAYPPGDDVYAAPYSNLWNSAGTTTTLTHGASYGFLTFPSTAGAVWSTAYDMVRWYDALFGHWWLSPESRRALTDNDGYIAYGLGIRMRNERGRSIYYHAGAWGFRSFMLHDPSTGISLCIAANQQGMSVSSAGYELFSEVLNRLPTPSCDIAIFNMEPNGTKCAPGVSPFITLQNRGAATVYQVQVAMGVQGVWQDTVGISLAEGLAPGALRTIPLSIDLGNADGHKRQWQVLVTSMDPPDVMPANNYRSAFYQLDSPETARASFSEDFETSHQATGSLISLQANNALDWRITRFAGHETPGHSLARINYYDANEGSRYVLDLPLIRVQSANTELSFSYAHAFYPGAAQEVLRGYITTQCSSPQYNALFELSGSQLATAPATTAVFLPNANQWRRYVVNLGAYAGEDVRIRLELENQYGNMTYLDDIRIQQQTTATSEEPDYKQVSVWPVPASTHFTVVSKPDFRIAHLILTDGMGKQIFEQHYSDGTTAPLQVNRGNLPAGCYFLDIRSTSGLRIIRRVVFQ